MISGRLLNKLEVGKKYLITNGIGFFILSVKSDVIWCSELGWHSNGFFGIYKREWDDVVRENLDDYDFCQDIKHRYDTTNPTYTFEAYVSCLFVGGRTYFSTYDLFFLGEYKENTDMKEVRRYCNLFGLTYKWESKKQRRKSIYK